MNNQSIEETLENRQNVTILTQQLATILTKYNIVKLQELSTSRLNYFLLEMTNLLVTFDKSLTYLPSSRIELIIRIVNNLIKLRIEGDQGTLNKLLKILNLCYTNYSIEQLPLSLSLEQIQILITLWFDRISTDKDFKWNEDVLNVIIGTLLIIIKFENFNFKEKLKSYLKINILGTILYHCLTISLEESYLQLRLNSLKLILTLININQDSKILYSIFPGIVGNLGKLITRDLVKESKQIIILGLKILINFIPNALICTKVEGINLLKSLNGKKINLVEGEEPMEGYNYKSHELIDNLFKHLIVLRSLENDEIQKLLVELSLIILKKCQHPNIIPKSINTPLDNLIFYLGKLVANLNDNVKEIEWLTNWYKIQSKEFIQQLKFEAEPMLKAKFEQFQIKLRTRADFEKLQVIYELFGCLILFGDQLKSRIPYNELLLSLCRWLKLSNDKISEIQETSSDIIYSSNSTIDNELNRVILPHLTYINTFETLELLSKLISYIGSVSDIADLATYCLDIYSSPNLPSFKIPSLFILLKLTNGNRENYQLPFNLNKGKDTNHIDLLELAILERVNSIESSDNYLVPYIQLHLYWNFINSQSLNFREHLNSHLYPILSKLTHNNPQLTNFTLTCLNLIKEKCEYTDLKEICLDNLDFLMNTVSDSLYDIEYKGIEACQVLMGLLRLIPDKSLNLLDSILDQLLEGLNINMFNDGVVVELLKVVQVVANEAIKLGNLDINLNSTDIISASDQLTNGLTSVNSKGRINCSDSMKQVLKELDDIYHVQKVNQPIIEEINDGDEEGEFIDKQSASRLPEDEDISKPNNYQEFCLRILKPLQYFLSSDNSQLKLKSLSIIGIIFKFGSSNSSNSSVFLNELHNFWSPLMQRVKDQELTVIIESMRVVGDIIEFNHDFLMSRINEELVNSVLTHLSQIKSKLSNNDLDYSNNFKLLDSSLILTMKVFKTGCLPNYRIRDLFIPIMNLGSKLLSNSNYTNNQPILSEPLSLSPPGSLNHILTNIQSNLTLIQSNVYIYQYLEFNYAFKLKELEGSLINQRVIELGKVKNELNIIEI